jgi:uncharacterized protein (TIGR03437 family)
MFSRFVFAFLSILLFSEIGVAQPNLTPYQPSGWSDAIVVSRVTGTNTDITGLTTADTLYVDWAVLNNGADATTVGFYTALYVDNVLFNSWYTDPPLNPNYYTYFLDYSLGPLAAGTHTIQIVTDSTNAIAESNESDNQYIKTISIATLQPQTATPVLTGIVNTASSTSAIAPGSVVTVSGKFPVTSKAEADIERPRRPLGGVTLNFSGFVAPLLHVSPTALTAQVPWELSGQASASVTVSSSSQTSAAMNVSLTLYAPGIFTVNGQGTGQGTIVDQNGMLADVRAPAIAGMTVVKVFATGLGPVTPQPATGAGSPANPVAVTTTNPLVTIGGIAAPLLKSELTPGTVGMYELDVQVPAGVNPTDSAPVQITIGGAVSNSPTMAIRTLPTNSNASLVSINPSSGAAGQALTAVLTGSNTTFLQGQTTISLGDGISVGAAPEGLPGPPTVGSATSATVVLTIDPAAAAGTRTVSETTGTQTLTLSSAFNVTSAPAPMGPLAVLSTVPASSGTGVSTLPAIQIQFNEPLDPATANAVSFGLARGSTALPFSVGYDASKYVVTLTPSGRLTPQTAYTVTAGTALHNIVGSPLAQQYQFSFTTLAPLSVTGSLTLPSGLNPTTITVVSYGATTSTPGSNGTFTASLRPDAPTLIAGMFPNQSFGLMAFTVPNASAGATAQAASVREHGHDTEMIFPNGRRVYVTRHQITASAAAAATASTPVMDYQTTAESAVFLSPYLYTADPSKYNTIATAIAAAPQTAALAQTLAQNASTADPYSVPAVHDALSAAQQAVVVLLAQQSAYSPPTNSGSMDPSVFIAGPVPVIATPNCAAGEESTDDLPCLDLDYISFSGAIKANQDGTTYTVAPQNCVTSSILGCTVGWLGRTEPIYIPGGPAAITAAGTASSPSSPILANEPLTCSGQGCSFAWIPGDSWLRFVDLAGDMGELASNIYNGVFGGGVNALTAELVLPVATGAEQDYIARFYSGGSHDQFEVAHTADYANGASLSATAYSLNVIEASMNVASSLLTIADVPGPQSVMACAVGTLEVTAIESATAQASGKVSTQVAFAGSIINSIMSSAVNCLVSEGANDATQAAVKMIPKIAADATGVGEVLDGLSVASNLGQVLQRITEMNFYATPIETAVIAIQPGASSPYNAVPSISALSPFTAAVGGESQNVTIQGKNLQTNTVVSVNGTTRSTTLGPDGSLQITLTSSDLQQTAYLLFAVTNPLPGGGTAEALFPVGTPTAPTPAITSLNPSAIIQNMPASIVLGVTGSGFLPNATVTINGQNRQTTMPSDTGMISVILQPADISTTGNLPVVVQNPNSGPSSNSFPFTVLPSQPPQPGVLSIFTNKRIYVTGDRFWLTYNVISGVSNVPVDLIVTFTSIASGTTYYYYYNPNDSNSAWIHSSTGALISNEPPYPGLATWPQPGTVNTITSSTPSGTYHIQAFFVQAGGAQSGNTTALGQVAQTDYSIATTTAPGGCFIATAAFGSDMAGQVQLLRLFRDRLLLPRSWGRSFVNWYYSWSPVAASWLRDHPFMRRLTRAALILPVAFAWLSLRTGMLPALLLLLFCVVGISWCLWRGSRLTRALSLTFLILVVACV